MTLAKRPPPVPPPPLVKAVPYPSEAIWREWEEDQPVVFRGNTFKRQGQKISRVFDAPPSGATRS
ncbi:MAG TPA: hypothetical protein VM686_01450 [Polyangiaceae bacterium]|jgi:hypothetical protein|nr:hypothetical protein [Polyangiaceae bacterium]